MLTTLDAPPRAPMAAPPHPRRGELALALQEGFTAAVRLRGRRQRVADAATFRAQAKHLLALARADAGRAGYDPAAIKAAIHAYVAFLDESVLGSGDPGLASWSGKSLQEEMFGDHNAGESFFVELDRLLAAQDSEPLGDLLEVYLLCLLLGYRGRYATDRGALDARVRAAREKVARIRGGRAPLSSLWPLPADEPIAAPRDPWARRLWIAAAASAALALVLYLAFRLSLGAWVGEIRALAASPR